MTTYVVRHGSTKANEERIIMGHLDTPLSEVGIADAEFLVRRLKNISFDKIYSSDLKRATQTADIIAQHIRLFHDIFQLALEGSRVST